MVIWKGKDFKDYGIVVEYTPKIPKPKKRISQFTVEGRNGFVSIDDGTYEPFSLSIECHVKEDVNFNEMCEFLDGFGTLSFDGIKQYTAIINNSIPFEKVMMFKKFVVQFLANPICEDIESETFVVESDSEILDVSDTYYDIEPVMTVECSGDVSITINNQTFHLDNTDGIYVLDCKNKLITNNGLNASSIMNGDFIKLYKGKNEISYIGNITNFYIEYKKTYLWGG